PGEARRAAQRGAGSPSDVGDAAGAVQPPERLELHQPGLARPVRDLDVPRLVPRRRLSPRLRGASPDVAAPPMADAWQMGPEVAEAPAVARRPARHLSGRAPDLDAPRPGGRRA